MEREIAGGAELEANTAATWFFVFLLLLIHVACGADVSFPQVQKMRWRVEPEEARPPDKPQLCCCITEKVYTEFLHPPFALKLKPPMPRAVVQVFTRCRADVEVNC